MYDPADVSSQNRPPTAPTKRVRFDSQSEGRATCPLDYVIVAAIHQRGPFRSRLLPVCCPVGEPGTASAQRRRPARPVTRTVVGWR
jgi:hypothetical protein